MAYQQPGGYPGGPQYAAGPGRPPAPQSVQRAFPCILAGAALSLATALVSVTQHADIRDQLAKTLPDSDPAALNSLVTATYVVTFLMAAVEVGLWIWMAYATRSGKNWARILSTVFFGVNAAGTVFATLAYAVTSSGGAPNSAFASGDSAIGQILDWLTCLVGLAAIVLLYQKTSTAYFKPQQYYPMPYGYPGYPGYGHPGGYPYPYQGYPQAAQPGQAPAEAAQPAEAVPASAAQDAPQAPPQD